MNMYSFIDELKQKGCRICYIYPQQNDPESIAYYFENTQHVCGYQQETNFDIEIMPGGVPSYKRVNRDINFKYNHIRVVGLDKKRIDELLDNNGSELDHKYNDAGIDDFYNFAYVDEENNLNLIFDYCNFDGRIFGEPENKALAQCFC